MRAPPTLFHSGMKLGTQRLALSGQILAPHTDKCGSLPEQGRGSQGRRTLLPARTVGGGGTPFEGGVRSVCADGGERRQSRALTSRTTAPAAGGGPDGSGGER